MLNGAKVTKKLLNELDNAKKPQTNAGRIRAMSDEELAELLANEVPHDCAYCTLLCATFDGDKFAESCQNAFYRWLQQPAEIFSR